MKTEIEVIAAQFEELVRRQNELDDLREAFSDLTHFLVENYSKVWEDYLAWVAMLETAQPANDPYIAPKGA